MGYKLSETIDSLSFAAFAKLGLKIITMEGKLVFLDLNKPQLLVHSVLEAQRQAGLPMRAIVLKARREGISTYVSGKFFRDINRRPMRYACTCSADAEATDKVFKMVRLFQDEIPIDIKRQTDYSSRKEIIYSPPHRSQFLCQTAGTDVLGRGGLTHYLHATEFAFWNKAKEQFGGAAQEIPDDPETCIVIESTANGMGGPFYDMFVSAIERYKRTKSLDGYMPIFLPWFIFEKYQKKLPKGWTATAEELELKKEYNLSLEQLCWRRWAIENKCQNDIRLFKQEYPACVLEAFQMSGSPVFTSQIIEYQKRFIRDDIQYGLFDHRDGSFIPNAGGNYGWQVLDGPGGEDHVIGIDTREHKLSDDKDPKSDRDFDGAVVLSRKSGQKLVKAILHGKMGQKELGLQILGAAKHYNNAWVVPEIPMGMMVVQVLSDAGYQNIYHRRNKEFQYVSEDTDDLGYRTTNITRHYLINDMISVLRSNAVICQFSEIIAQMMTFIYDKTGKPIHMPAKHDDLMFGLSLAIQGDLYCPKNISDEIPVYTGVDGDPRKPARTINDLAFMGAIDNFNEEDEEESWGFTE